MSVQLAPQGIDPHFQLPIGNAKASVKCLDGASDTLALVDIARRCKAVSRLCTIITAEAFDMIRLAEELRWLAPDLNTVVFPDWETLPYDTMSPHEDLVSERLETLYRIATVDAEKSARVDILIASATTAAQRIAPKSFILGRTFVFSCGEHISLPALQSRLVEAGYGHVEQVMAPGEFSVRGGIIDVYPMGSKHPFRLDLFDDEIETIRIFDPETQRSTGEVQNIRILPGQEFPMDELSRNRFRTAWRETFSGDPNKSPIYADMGNGVAAAGIEYYLPLFFDKTQTLSDYLPNDSLIVTCGDITQSLTRFSRETRQRWEFLSHDHQRPALEPTLLADDAETFFIGLSKFARLAVHQPDIGAVFSVAIDRKAKDPVAKLRAHLDATRIRKTRTLISATSPGRAARLHEQLSLNNFSVVEVDHFDEFLRQNAPVCLCVSPLIQGVQLSTPAIEIITETELYSLKATRRRSRIKESASRVDAMIRDISELKIGDPVVHVEHGVGRYAGLQTLDTGEGVSEFVRIDYAKEAKLFVPVAQLHLISRYSGADADHAPLHTLGKGDWDKAKKKAAQKVRDTAAELLNIYAKRQLRKGFLFDRHAVEYEAFCEGFEFEETPDQAAAIRAVIDDMNSERPMDRLVCGDVGFGKTEVALRAAFVAAMNGKQVAVLCPTTLLAEQHAHTFKDRFAAWPIKIAELSRFRSGKETTAAIEGLKNGTIDVAIGTHKLLSDKIQFARLGLIIIDEEHRFGVRQKEQLKNLRSEVDVLTLTATPIPRTLAMSLEGIRDFSVIATAPEKRLAIKTFVRRESKELIREAVIREFKRGGQVYFLHNEVDTIQYRYERLCELLPEARIGIAHGQMSERELERVMRDFYQQRFNLLLCTTIIETGIDIPNANTILMHRADRFGLAQLHQLRGRVGRSHHQAYAYLMTPDEGAITKNAQKRLEAIQNLEDLGSGFYLSMHDLEIRGAGEVLGEEQSGEITQVGFELYSQMLQNAVEAMKRGESAELEHPFSTMTEINLHLPALLPEDFVPDVSSRLSFYKQLAAANEVSALEQVIDALNDRYGKLPVQAKTLIASHRLRLVCKRLGISKIDAADEAIVFSFNAKPKFEPMAMIRLLQTRRDLRMLSGDKLRMTVCSHDLETRVQAVRTITNALEASLEG